MASVRTKKGKLGWLLRLGVSAVVLVVIFRLVPPAQIVAAARQLSPATWLLSLALFLFGHLVAAFKWRLLVGDEIPVGAALRAHLAGLSANIALPGVAGGDVVRAALVAPLVRSRAQLAVGSLMDRVIDTVGLLCIALAGSWLVLADRSSGVRIFLLVAILAAVIGGVAGLFAARPLERWVLRTLPNRKIGTVAARLLGALGEFAARPWRLLSCLLLSLAVQCLFVTINIWLADDIGLHLPAASWFAAWSLAKIIAIAPISFGGLGVREASMAALLQPFGAPPQQVVAVGLVWQTILYASGFIGFLVQALVSASRRGAPVKASL